MRLPILAIVAVMLAGCASVRTDSQGLIEPAEAIRAANDDPVHGVRGRFLVTVKALDSQPQWSYLNSERDYRDQRNLTLRMPTAIVPKLEQRLGVPFAALKNRRLVVLGVARRARIDFIVDGRPTGKYYYQTHVVVSSPTQIDFAD